MNEFFLSPSLLLVQKSFLGGFFIYCLLLFIVSKKNLYTKETIVILFKKIFYSLIVYYIFFSLILSIGQYLVWNSNPITKNLLSSPISQNVSAPIFKSLSFLSNSSLGYFTYYIMGRIWIGMILSILSGIIFWYFLKILRKYNNRFFEDGEVELGGVCALILGWPNFVIFLPLIFLSVIFISLFKIIFLKEKFTTLGYPFLLATLITIFYGIYLIKFLNLEVLKI